MGSRFLFNSFEIAKLLKHMSKQPKEPEVLLKYGTLIWLIGAASAVSLVAIAGVPGLAGLVVIFPCTVAAVNRWTGAELALVLAKLRYRPALPEVSHSEEASEEVKSSL